METLLNKIKKVIEIEKGKEVVVMYSGGMDSSLLIVSLQKLNYKPIPVFFDDNSPEFNLRQMPAMTSFLTAFPELPQESLLAENRSLFKSSCSDMLPS
jgi:argininosuccinate synthase